MAKNIFEIYKNVTFLLKKKKILFFWVKHDKASLVQNMFFCFLNSMTQNQKQAWVVNNFLINSVHVHSIGRKSGNT